MAKFITVKKQPKVYSGKVTFIIALRGRTEFIAGFIQSITRYYPDAPIIFAVQGDDKPFNKGVLYNLAYKQSNTEYVAFHDIDIRHTIKLDFNQLMAEHEHPFTCFNEIAEYRDNLLISSNFRGSAWGGCTVFTRNQFEACGGFSNLINHWGYDDAIINKRANLHRITHKLDHIYHKRLDGESRKLGHFDKNASVFKNDNPETDNYNTAKGTLTSQHIEGNIKWLEYQDLGNTKIIITPKPKEIINHKIGAIYSTFYDLDMIKDSIISINPVVSYIVLVHQKVGFNGAPEPDINKSIIADLLKHNYIDDIVYYEGSDAANGMLEKLNIGLEYIKSNNCQFVLGMSPDERYNARLLNDDVDYMIQNNIDTLYMPIKAYYYDDRHYFVDTYFSQSVHRVNERVYQRSSSNFLCDPQKKMIEGNYYLSDNHVHHYTFIKDKYDVKLENSIRTTTVARHKRETKMILDNLNKWKEGELALVFGNDMYKNGRVVLMEKELSVVPKSKIAILIPFWKRNEITSFVFDYYNKLKTKLSEQIELILIAVGSEKKISKAIAEKNGFIYLEYPNTSIQLKHDFLYSEAKKYNPDACLKIDSDTIVDTEFFFYWDNLVRYGCDYSDVLDIYFMFKNGVCYWSGYKTVQRIGEGTGVGRFTSKRLLDMLDWKIVGSDKKGVVIDYFMTQRIKGLDIIRTNTTCKSLGANIVELKSDLQLTDVSNATFDKLMPNSFLNIDIENIIEYLAPFENLTKHSYSVIIPTMWKSNYILSMLPIYEACSFISEVIIIDNKPESAFDISMFEKVKIYTENKNIYVNPAWNWGASLANSENIIIANDDILFDKSDFENLLSTCNTFLKPNMIIAPGEHCFKQKTLQLSELNFGKAKERNWGFGTFMILKKESYTIIPDDLLVWCGDDILFQTNVPYNFTGIEIKTPMNVTIKSEGLRNIGVEDITRAEKYEFNKLPKLK